MLGLALLTLIVLLVDIRRRRQPQRVVPDRDPVPGPVELRHRPGSAGTLYLMAVCAAFIIPVGVASAIYLEEYANRENWFNRFIEVNIQNLAAVPSIVYGVLGGVPRSGFAQPRQRGPRRAGSPSGFWSCRWSSSPDARRSRRSRHPSARARWRSARRSGRRSGSRCCPPRSQASRRGDPRDLTGDRRDRAADRGRSGRVPDDLECGLLDGQFSALPIQIFGWTADSEKDYQALAAGDHRPHGDSAGDERGRDLATKSIRAEVVGG